MVSLDSEKRTDSAYLDIDKQTRLVYQVRELAAKENIYTKLIFPHTPISTYAALLPLSFFTWRAGFRGYGLSKYNRGRILTAVLALVYPSYGGFTMEVYGSGSILDPFRKENPLYFGTKLAMVNQFGIVSTIVGNIGLSFLFATRSGLLPIPEGMHRPGVREVAIKMLLARIKPYTRSIVLSAAFSTAASFALGVAAFYQSNVILSKLNRKSIIYKED